MPAMSTKAKARATRRSLHRTSTARGMGGARINKDHGGKNIGRGVFLGWDVMGFLSSSRGLLLKL